MRVSPSSMPLRFYNTLTQQVEEFQPRARQHRPHVHLRPDGLRLRPHRQFPHVHVRRHPAPVAARQRLRARSRDEHHRCGRQDHPQRRGAATRSAEEYTAIYTQGIPRRLRQRCGWSGPSTWSRPPSTSTKWSSAIQRLTEARPHLRQRRLGLLPHLDFPGIRQALAQRFQRQHRGRARGRGRVRKGRRPRLRPVEGAQGRRAGLGDADRPGPSRAGTSSAPSWPSSIWARRSISTPAAST